MSDAGPAKMRDGTPYAGHRQFLGTGLRRSCGKCNTFGPLTDFKLMRPWGMCCSKCREAS